MEENEKLRTLCLNLIYADSEENVIKILNDAGYWKYKQAWRYYGDYENNYNTIGNQMSRPDAALVEKLVNSIDATLMNECYLLNIEFESKEAPQTIREAVALFYEDNPNSSTAGLIREWDSSKRTEVSKNITLSATGARPRDGNPCFTISDSGEGQRPQDIPNTLLSLTKSNKLRIPFVQGKFNMGGTGVLKFCGKYNLQLIITKRNPKLLNQGKDSIPSDQNWGFTIVRRENPEGRRRNSIYTYLAPIGMQENPFKGEVLNFHADKLPIFPEKNKAYHRFSTHGTLIKLYNYAAIGYKSNILLKDGIMRRIDLLLPDVALPIRLHECRDFGGHGGSADTTLSGIKVRLEDNKGENLEDNFPTSSKLSVNGEEITATIYAFKKGKADTYRKNEGIIFTLNGQTHGHLTKDFFRRTRVGMSYLSDSILVILDCSKISGRSREDLFMNSRDRLSGAPLRNDIESALEELLKNHPLLRELREKRRRDEVDSRLSESKPLSEILNKLVKNSPTLATLFLQGKHISNPFKSTEAQAKEIKFEGKKYPTYFKFKDKDYETILEKDCHINLRCKINFETDVDNDYFSRDINPGTFSLFITSEDKESKVDSYSLSLQNGIATLFIQLPPNCVVNDRLNFSSIVNDDTQLYPFENNFIINVKETFTSTSGGTAPEQKKHRSGDGPEKIIEAGLQLPHITKVYEQSNDDQKTWAEMDPPFNKTTALKVINAGDTNGNNGKAIYDFYVNVDNLYLKNEIKNSKADHELVSARFIYGLVLLGLGLLHHYTSMKLVEDSDEDTESEKFSIEDSVEIFSAAVAPVLLPLIEQLGSLNFEDNFAINDSGENV
jgi:hypothetical protein